MKIKSLEFGVGEILKPKKGKIAFLPVLKETYFERNYVTLEEVSEKIEIKDTGSISKLKVTSDIKKPVLIRGGSMLKGKGTQSRANQHLKIIKASQEGKISVRCIHASHHISSGNSFEHSGDVPKKVQDKLSKGNQSQVWNRVEDIDRAIGSAIPGPEPSKKDDLVFHMKKFKEFLNQEVIGKMPRYENQVGVLVLDSEGVIGLELFDNPKSWEAVSKNIMEKYGSLIVEEGEFQLNEEEIKTEIKVFLSKLNKAESELRGEKYQVGLLKGEGVRGEFAKIEGRTVYFLGKRDEN